MKEDVKKRLEVIDLCSSKVLYSGTIGAYNRAKSFHGALHSAELVIMGKIDVLLGKLRIGRMGRYE